MKLPAAANSPDPRSEEEIIENMRRELDEEPRLRKRKLLETWPTDQLDPNNWLEIPEFDVKPASVRFEGFAFPIVHPRCKPHAEAVRELVVAARKLARRRFSKLADLRAAAARMWMRLRPDDLTSGPEPASEDERTAFTYQLFMGGLESILHRPSYLKPAFVLESLASSASLLVNWAMEGPAASSEIGRMGALARLRHDPRQAAKRSVYAHWHAWHDGRVRYKGKGPQDRGGLTAFADAMLENHPALSDTKTIQQWCRDFAKGQRPLLFE